MPLLDGCRVLPEEDVKKVDNKEMMNINAKLPTTKAKKLLNYNPSYSFYDGIKLTLDWYKKTSKI